MTETQEPTNGYERMKRGLARDQSLTMETREAVAHSDFSAQSLTREYSRLLEDQDLTQEARERRAAEAREHYAPRVKKERGRAKELLAKEAERLERASIPKPKGESLETNDPTRLLLIQGESERLRRIAEKRKANPVFKNAGIVDWLKSEYRKGIDEAGVQGATRCAAVLRYAEEEGVSAEEIVNSLRSLEQMEKADRARQLMLASWSIPLEASNIPRSLQQTRRLSRRPEQHRPFSGAAFVTPSRGEPVYKRSSTHMTGASEEATATLPTEEQKTLPARKKSATSKRKKAWK